MFYGWYRLVCRVFGHRRLYGSGSKKVGAHVYHICGRCLWWYHD